MTEYQAPHCNTEVLHAPGSCQFCDEFPDRQSMRAASGTPFTPAQANGWRGNVAQPTPTNAEAPNAHQPSLRQRLRELMGL